MINTEIYNIPNSNGTNGPKNDEDISAYKIKYTDELKIELPKFSSNYIAVNPSTYSSSLTIIEQNSILDIYPNPVRSEATISYSQVKTEDINIKLYNIKGELVDSYQTLNSSGKGRYTFNVRNMSSGVYIVVLGSDEFSIKKKVIILK